MVQSIGMSEGVMSGVEGVARRSRALINNARSLVAADRIDKTPSK